MKVILGFTDFDDPTDQLEIEMPQRLCRGDVLFLEDILDSSQLEELSDSLQKAISEFKDGVVQMCYWGRADKKVYQSVYLTVRGQYETESFDSEMGLI